MSPVDRVGWDCPSCGRQVPRRVATCRCGYAQPREAAPDETHLRVHSSDPEEPEAGCCSSLESSLDLDWPRYSSGHPRLQNPWNWSPILSRPM